MGNFMNLIRNENMKIYRRVRTWVMFGFAMGLPLLIALILVANSNRGDIGAWESFGSLAGLYFIVTIFSAIIFAEIVASEFTWGTIKLLLIRPWTRTKILASKLISSILFSLLLTLVFYGFIWAISFLFFPNEGDAAKNIIPGGYSPMEYMVTLILFKYVDLLVISIISFMLSAVFRSGNIAIGLSIFLLFAGNILQSILNPTVYPWTKYVLFTNLNLSQYMYVKEIAGGMTLGFSAAVLAVYTLIFLFISWLVFNKRDVAA